MWPGESEKTIAATFKEAADLRAFLTIDEADSLLGNRLAAQHSWGDHAGQRNANADGAASLPFRLHNQRSGTFRRGGDAAVSFQGTFSTDDRGSNREGLPPRFRSRAPNLRPQTERFGGGRFRNSCKEVERARRAQFNVACSMA